MNFVRVTTTPPRETKAVTKKTNQTSASPTPTSATSSCADGHPYQVGANYFIRTVTHHYTGRLVAVYEHELVIEDAAWIADDGRFMLAVRDGAFSEVEPYPDGLRVVIGRGGILDACVISFTLPRSQK